MPKRRMELVGEIGNIKVYDDFAHHPTAIATTIEGLRKSVGADKHIICVFEPRSNSMKMGANSELLGASFKDADEVFVYQNEAVSWDMSILVRDCPKPLTIVDTNTANLIDQVVAAATAAASDCLTEHMNLPIGCFAFGNKSVKRPSSSPHNIASCLVIVRIFYRNKA